MKKLGIFTAIILFLFAGSNLSAQTAKAKTETLKVLGNCSMCKDRIEKAAKVDGVESAAWDSKTKLLTVAYNPSKTDKDAVAKKVAAAGHDTEKFKAEEKVYNSLPGCCKYDRTGKTTSAGHSH